MIIGYWTKSKSEYIYIIWQVDVTIATYTQLIIHNKQQSKNTCLFREFVEIDCWYWTHFFEFVILANPVQRDELMDLEASITSTWGKTKIGFISKLL